MGSSTDAKKTARRKPKKPASTTASKGDCLLSNPGTATIATTTTTTTTTASLQSVRRTKTCVSSESMNTVVHFTDSASTASCSQEQEVQSMQKTSTSGTETDRKSPSQLPSAKFYLNGDGCFFCCRSKIGNAEVNLHNLVESKSGGELSSLPQLWICLECQQSFNQKEIDSVATDINEELMLDSSLLSTNEVSKVSPLSSNTCNCFSCTETRHIKEQNESFEQELQQYLYEDLHQLVAFIYQASLSTLTADVHEEYQLSINNTMKLHNVMQKIYCRNPQRLFRCLESWAAALIMERRSALCERLPATFQQLTVCTASQLITSLLDEYSCFCFVGQNLMSLFDSQGNSTLKEFRLTLELHQQYLFHQLIFAQLQKFLTSAVAMISMQMTRLRTENAATANPHSLLLQKYAKFQDEMNQILIRWMKYCQPSETSKDENWWQDNQRSSKSRICEMKTRPNIQTEGTESYLAEGIWHLPGLNECNVSSHYPSYSDLGSPAAPLEIASPSSSQRSESSGSECSSQDDKCDTCQILESFIQNSRELVNSDNAIRAKEETNNDTDQNVEEQKIIGASSHLIVNLCDHCSEDHLNADEDDSGEDADDDCDEIEDAGKGHEVTVVQPTLEQQCQCFSCINVSSTVSTDLSQQSLIPSFSSLSIYPPVYGSTMPVLQQGQIVNHDLQLSQSRVQQAFQIQGQQGSKEQIASKSSNPESCANVMSNKTLLPEWDLQNSLFFKHENNYGKIMLAPNDGPLLTTMSVVSSASETQTIVDNGNVWFKVDQPSTVANSAIILPQNGVTALSPGLFKINADYLHLSQSLSSGASVFPLSMPGTYAGIPVIGEVDQHPQCSLHQPVAVTTSASNVFSIASSFYQNTSSSTTFVQTPAFGQSTGGASETSSSTLYGLSSGMKLPEESLENVYVNDSLLYETGTNSTAADGTHANASLANFRLCAVDVSSNYDAVDAGDEIPLCTSSGFADIAPHMCSMFPETMEQFNIHQATTVAGSEIVVCAASTDNHVPLTYRHSLPLHCPGSDSQPSGCSEDQQSLTSCKADSQQDDNDCVSQDESGSSGSNMKDGKFCDCWHCEVFGRSTPATLPTSRNFPEVRDRLRLRLKKKKSTQNAVELEKTEDTIAAAPVQQNVSDMKDIEEVMKFINGGGGDGAEIPQKDELIKSKNKAAKRSRQKLRKQQKVKEPVKSEVSVGSQTNHCDSNKQKNALLSHCASSSHATDCCKNSKSNIYDRSDSSKKTNNKVENMTLRNMLNTMKLNGKHIVNIDKTAAGLEEKLAHCDGSENGRVKELETNFTSHSSSMQKNGILAPDLVKNGMLRHSASHNCVLGKGESLHGNTAGTGESSVLSIQNAKSEPEEDFRFEGGMKPVTISSEDGVRTILASPLLQAELAKNKPLQKLFMQAVQQQQQSREKQEAKAMAETEVKSCQHPVNQFSSTVASLQSRTREAAKQQLCPVAHKSSCVSVTAESAGMLEQKATRSDESKILHHFQRNGTAVNKKCMAKLQQNGCQSVGTTSHQANQTRSSVVPREKTLFSRAQPYTISDEKLQDNSTRSSVTPAPRKTTQNGKTCSKLSTGASSVSGFGAQSVSNVAQCGCREHCRTDCLPSSGCLVPNKLHPQISNGFSSSVASPVATKDPSLLQLEATAAKVLSKQRGKKPTNSRASKKSVLPSTRNEQSGLCIENGREAVKKVDFIGTDKDCSRELEVLMKTDSEKQRFLLTLPASADAAECFGNDEDAEPCLNTKTKKSKKKSKSRGSVASVDEIFLPKNVQDDSHLDEHEREIEEFKRFCSNSAPSGNRQKVNLNNVKDMFNKKKTVSAGYQ